MKEVEIGKIVISDEVYEKVIALTERNIIECSDDTYIFETLVRASFSFWFMNVLSKRII